MWREVKSTRGQLSILVLKGEQYRFSGEIDLSVQTDILLIKYLLIKGEAQWTEAQKEKLKEADSSCSRKVRFVLCFVLLAVLP